MGHNYFIHSSLNNRHIRLSIFKDRIFRALLLVSGLIVLLVCIAMAVSLVKDSREAFRTFGFWGFISSSEWNPSPSAESYGALPFIVGTLVTSLLALVICIPFSLPVALFTGEYFRGTKVANIVSSLTDLLAGIPSIVYGLWGFYAFRPLIISLGINEQGFGIVTASLILSIMIIPYASSLSSQFIAMTPSGLKESAYSLGATRWEVIRSVIFPNSKTGIFAAYILALGRALGETMAVTMLVGNTNQIPQSLADTGNSMASLIANQFGEADGLKLSSLIAIALVLFLITAVINAVAKYIMKKTR